MFALHAYECGWRLPDGDLVRNTINNNDVEMTKQLLIEYEMLNPKNVKPE